MTLPTLAERQEELEDLCEAAASMGPGVESHGPKMIAALLGGTIDER